MREIVQITKHTDYEGVYKVKFSFDGVERELCYINLEVDSELGAATRFMYQQDSKITILERNANGWINLSRNSTVGELIDREEESHRRHTL